MFDWCGCGQNNIFSNHIEFFGEIDEFCLLCSINGEFFGKSGEFCGEIDVICIYVVNW